MPSEKCGKENSIFQIAILATSPGLSSEGYGNKLFWGALGSFIFKLSIPTTLLKAAIHPKTYIIASREKGGI